MNAYVSRLKTGLGQHVDTSLLETGIAYTIWESAIFFATGIPPGPVGSGHHLTAPYQAFATADGYVMVGGANQANWERLCGAIGREDLLQNENFASNSLRVQNVTLLAETLQETLSLQSTSHWLEVLGQSGVPCGPINDMADVYSDPHVVAREMMVELEHPLAGTTRNIGVPIKLSATPASVRTPSPTLGQHTDAVLADHGYTPDDISGLKERGVVR